ncbi:MAG: VOC family protein [Actinomycetia bacterium]|nr:VOC family protein [Actinomycetes bacterium]
MTERDTAWPAGTPCWVDITTADPDAARAFYGELFGWQLEIENHESISYTIALAHGRPVAGIGVCPPNASAPASWTTYLATDDATATVAKITAAGGRVLMPILDVMGEGMMAVAADPTGGVFGIWQAGRYPGFTLANVAGADVWNELMTSDFAAAKKFYTAVFDHTCADMGGAGLDYATLSVGGRVVAGVGAAEPGAASHWRAYFGVEDPDATLAKVTSLGGRVLRPAADSPFGRWGEAADPQGATFAVVTPPTEVD